MPSPACLTCPSSQLHHRALRPRDPAFAAAALTDYDAAGPAFAADATRLAAFKN